MSLDNLFQQIIFTEQLLSEKTTKLQEGQFILACDQLLSTCCVQHNNDDQMLSHGAIFFCQSKFQSSDTKRK